MQDTEMDLHVLFRAIHDSVGANCVAVQQLSGGSNNRLYRIETREGRSLLAKKYFNDNRSRLVREYGVLTALCKRGFNEVPKPCARLDELNTGVYSFVHGRHIDSFDFTRDHITKIANFLAKMHDVTRADVSLEVPMGFMSARSLSEVIALIRGRIELFKGEESKALSVMVQDFLTEASVLDTVESLLEGFIQRHNRDRLNRRLPDADLRLSPIDFGAHNMLWRTDGSLVVLDFEYGGWDHPLHVIDDFFAHDKSQGITSEDEEFSVTEYLRQSPLSETVLCELDDYRHLSQLDWIMVYMSSMLPDKLARLAYAKGATYNEEAHIERQIKKIRERISRLSPTVS